MSFVEVLAESELWIGEMRPVVVRGRRVLLLRTERGVHAYEDRCPHLGYPLSRGRLDGSTLTCSAHEFRFDADTGGGENPKSLQLTGIEVECRQGKILVDVGPAAAER
ncbi:MAG TPA: Rieske 2Fe-2S domain-containing protein [Polyangiaceae bacterium]|nr:Rieske 2Fe-2S domain-containing protein [Polyangiaceae bacterium]